jgi:hypothetical protein
MARYFGSQRGNFTRGVERRGNKNGRPPMYEPGTPLAYIHTKVPNEHNTVLRTMGRGNAARGARMAIAWATKIMPLWAQDEDKLRDLLATFDGKSICQREASAAYRRLERALSTFWDDKATGPEPLKRIELEPEDCRHGIREDLCPHCTPKCPHGVREILCEVCSPMDDDETEEQSQEDDSLAQEDE